MINKSALFNYSIEIDQIIVILDIVIFEGELLITLLCPSSI
jgi:hypothetical protein